MKKKFDVISIGFIVQDIVLTDIPANALSRDTSAASSATVTSGGDAANQAVTLGRLGSHVALLSKIGTDSVGNSIYSTLDDEPVDRSLILRDDDAEMMLSIVVVKPDGERSFLVRYGNQKSYLAPEDITDTVLQSADIITVGSLFCLPGLDGAPIADVLARAHIFGAVTICDITHDQYKVGPKALLDVYPHIDYLLPSMEEAVYVTGETDPDKIADFFLSKGVKNVLIKLGSDGCFFKNTEKRFFSDPYAVTPLDTTGCGDCFLGGFAHALQKGWALEKCADFACAVGAINATGIGAHHTVQNEAHVLDFMAHTPRRALCRK